ncbi:endonuclease/exonuclease/phosphatase family protein [Dactylosporangium vinaceum]|uniref:Endonuclease/exonuclease/phosphatase family protein n=1 Tax=Dactylosporangium vinaceum TaxID=53362 RepID=A0ABV5MLI0_9ACTN|nr:endonuclease/exonuclease/phosphatase family protein [Dactylosporangium vinaceum]UAB96959.1 endonuclease/exonuclease/phosphatase family protein [Dactylosporangium vinaceum]
MVSLVQNFLPWSFLGVVVMFEIALWTSTRAAFLGFVVSGAMWMSAFGGALLPADGRPADLVVVQHNFSDENADPAGTVRVLMEVQPDLIGLEEITREIHLPLRYRAVFGTVGLWSRYPITEAEPIDIKPHGLQAEWRRGLRAVVRGVVIYVVHLPSVRMRLNGFDTAWRDDSARQLGARLGGERSPVLLIGDLNGTVDDRGLRPITRQMTTARTGFAWSFPAAFPVGRIDQVMVRGGAVTVVWTLRATGSDHLPVAARTRVGASAAI